MGEEVDLQEFTRADRTRYREKVRRCLDVFARMLQQSAFDAGNPMTGMEIEFNLVDDQGQPALKNAEALEKIASPAFQTELAQFNLEINVPPRRLEDTGLTRFEEGLRRSLNNAEERSSTVGAHLVMIGILPTLAEGHLRPDSISANPRYRLLSEQILDARGEDLERADGAVGRAPRRAHGPVQLDVGVEGRGLVGAEQLGVRHPACPLHGVRPAELLERARVVREE